jgi:hypothetical protein
VCAVSSDKGPFARHASRALRRACGQGAVLSLCMVRPGSGRFGVGFWVGFWVTTGWDCALELRARDFPTERVLSRTPLVIRTVDQEKENEPRLLRAFSFHLLPIIYLYFRTHKSTNKAQQAAQAQALLESMSSRNPPWPCPRAHARALLLATATTSHRHALPLD